VAPVWPIGGGGGWVVEPRDVLDLQCIRDEAPAPV
jgi:hypothetical protein